MIGRRLNHYEIVDELGSGGMGEVYVAEDSRLHRRVALKVLPPGLAEDPERLARFEREARTLATLNHPGIVTVFSVEEAEGLRFMTMELIDGETLDRVVPEAGLPLQRFFELAIPLADAIAAAHERGVQHRDLKPTNVMVGQDGRLKVLDFGLAKVETDSTGPEGMTEMATGGLTGEGRILGTVAYMSPEQAEGRQLDHRSDIFSLGILLYEMITGVRPFQGDTNITILSSILKDEPESITDKRAALPIPLARIVQRAIAKDAGHRYQSVADLRQDLVDLGKDVESGDVLVSSPGLRPAAGVSSPKLSDLAGGRRGAWIGVVAILILVALLAGPWLLARLTGPGGDAGPITAPVGGDAMPSVAVFYFDNINDDAELEWLRAGLAEMLVTNLSQSPGIRVLGTDRLRSILADMGRIEERTTSFDVVQRVAREAAVETAVVGSFLRAGDTIRINARVQDPNTGEVFRSERVEGRGEESIFGLVDDLTARIRADIEIADKDVVADARLAPKAIDEVTTDSVEAFRLYVEGVNLNEDSKFDAAIPLFERALEHDPEFAMAHAKLSVAHGNLGDVATAREYSALAMELADRLPARERHYIEGRHYSLDPNTADRAVEAYRRAVEMFPDHTAARHNLATQLFGFEQYEEAIVHLEELRARRTVFAPTLGLLADAHANTGDHERAVDVVREFVERNPDSAAGYSSLARHLASAGRHDEALAVFDDAPEFGLDPELLEQKWNVLALLDRWEEAEAVEEILLESREDLRRARGLSLRGRRHVFQGRLGDGREAMREIRRIFPAGHPLHLQSMLGELGVLADVASPEECLAFVAELEATHSGFQARQAVLATRAFCAARGGDEEAVTESMGELMGIVETLPAPDALVERVSMQLEGILAQETADHAHCAELLTAVLEMHPSKATAVDVVDSAYRLGVAHWELGDRDAAATRFHEVADSNYLRIFSPLASVRSLYYLGVYHDERGETDRARPYLRAFLDRWGDGEIDPERVADARTRLEV